MNTPWWRERVTTVVTMLKIGAGGKRKAAVKGDDGPGEVFL
jgi:hypothetical protein